MIEVRDLSCIFSGGILWGGTLTAVSPLSVSFRKGGRYAIVGESGSGKTTLARMMAGLQKPHGGNVYVEGRPVFGRRRAGKSHFKQVQLIQQNSAGALNPKMTIGKAIEEPLLCFFRLNRQERRKRCAELLALCNLPADYYRRLPSELSGGEQKRVAIARALAAEPACLIFDEATNGFDLPLRKKIMEEILDLQEKLSFTLIFITHDMELALAAADHILVMRDSVLVEQVPFGGDYAVFQNPYTKVLLAASGIAEPVNQYERNA
ncbi:Dipeptide transport ATP-binding protein DppF [Desulfitobacterium hafniense]|uniref:Dipeptide transport ATP-binding protein DppF n=1 Tax=Desulfitobacterium hafniense TaxID=49338 RepID=A0A098B272_DESHA|nr:ATP-binding cassette domain-containing protein [Desulfitobacterium hafniense]CDX02938.1 Dipeptide transport ATP-binding protein DppF [Desulfitobacterium hafniense]